MRHASVTVACMRPGECAVREACCAGYIPCIDMARVHAQKLDICDRLEAIADDLPRRVDRLQCLMVASSLVPLLRECHRFEEETIFPAYARAKRGGGAVVARLVTEHLEDAAAAEELSEYLLAYGHGQPIENPEAFGYMLRAIFEAMRRHVAFERDHMLPVLGLPAGA